jgi:hypothetical protein
MLVPSPPDVCHTCSRSPINNVHPDFTFLPSSNQCHAPYSSPCLNTACQSPNKPIHQPPFHPKPRPNPTRIPPPITTTHPPPSPTSPTSPPPKPSPRHLTACNSRERNPDETLFEWCPLAYKVIRRSAEAAGKESSPVTAAKESAMSPMTGGRP